MESGGTKRKGMGILLCVMVLFACACGEAWHARGAHAGGGGAYPNGAEGFLVGAAPPPGITFVNYLYYYHANEMMDDDGNGNPAFDEISVWAEVARFIWISKAQFLGANYGQHVFFLATDTDLDFTVPFGPKGDRHYHSTDIPYVIWSPCLLTWHLLEGRLHMVLDVADLYIPLSNEDKNDPSSLGRNFWTIEPVFAVTWLPAPAIELSAKFMYDFNTRQDDFLPGPPVNLDRTPGDEFHVDFAASYAVQPNLRLGVSGYYYRPGGGRRLSRSRRLSRTAPRRPRRYGRRTVQGLGPRARGLVSARKHDGGVPDPVRVRCPEQDRRHQRLAQVLLRFLRR